MESIFGQRLARVIEVRDFQRQHRFLCICVTKPEELSMSRREKKISFGLAQRRRSTATRLSARNSEPSAHSAAA